MNNPTAYTYDNSGNLKSVTDANNHTTTFEYNEQNLPTKTTNPLNQQRQFSYDVNRNLSLIVTPNGDNIKLFYNNGPGIDKPLILDKGGQKYYYHTDALGSITNITVRKHLIRIISARDLSRKERKVYESYEEE